MTSNRLRRALEMARPELEAGVAEVEAELAALDARREELLALLTQARAALGELEAVSGDGAAPPQRPLTLHEAMVLVLKENDNRWMSARELADEINARRLYTKRDGTRVELNQIHARSKNYSDMFEKNGSRIRVRAS